jgi:NTP pyrophosphatase (non-canonical NTP hydrolase)
MNLGDHARIFRETFGQECLDNIATQGFVKKKLWDMQLDLIEEEACELFDAAEDVMDSPDDMEKRINLVKELSDLVFVCYQFAAAFNIDLDEAMFRVFDSNMSKLDDNGEAIFREDGKVLKGPNYRKPDLSVCVPKISTTLN